MSSAGAVRDGIRVSKAARNWVAPLLVGFGVYVITCVFARSVLNDGDTLTHVAVGRWILEHGAIPFQDPFSFTARGQTWVPHEWLAEIVFAVAYDRAGWGGVVATTALAAAAAFALLTSGLAASLAPRRAVIGALLAFLLCIPHLLARPHVLAWPLLVIWMVHIVRARDAGRVPSLALLPVMIVWSNLHAGFVVGLGFAGLLAIEAIAAAAPSAWPRLIREWGVFIGLAAASALISPNGFDQYLLTFNLLGMEFAMAHIPEWRGVDFSVFHPLLVWLALAGLGGFALGFRLPLSRLAMVMLLFYEALTHVRHLELLGFIAPLLVAAPLAKQLGSATAPRPVATAAAGRPAGPGVASVVALTAAIALGFVVTALTLERSGLRPPETAAPVAAVAAARAAGAAGNVLNSSRTGGYLALAGIPVFIDGRADLFGDAFIRRFYFASSGADDGLPGLLEEFAIEWAIFEPGVAALAVLGHLPGWERLYGDRYAVVFRRTAKHPERQP